VDQRKHPSALRRILGWMSAATLLATAAVAAAIRHASAYHVTGQASCSSGPQSGASRPVRGSSVGLAERSSSSTAFFDSEPNFEEERPRGVFEPVYPQEPVEDFWEPLARSPRGPMHLSPDRLRASDLNELLQPDFLEEKRLAVSPMQAFGAMFKDATVLSGMHELNKESWTRVANAHSLPPPDDDDVQRAMGMVPERAISQAFKWTDDWGETRQWGSELREAYAQALPTFEFNATPGAVDWLTALNQYEVPCVVCSSVTREQVKAMLDKAGLGNLFQGIVAADDGCETTEQAYLLACLKIKRPPMKCVVFEDEPKGVIAAHDATAKAIAVIGNQRGGGLGGGSMRDFSHAEMRIGGLDELRLSHLREVAERESAPLW